MLQFDHSITPSLSFSITHTHNKHQDESDDEEKRALLAEENIQQLEDAEKVCNRDVICSCPCIQEMVTHMCNLAW